MMFVTLCKSGITLQLQPNTFKQRPWYKLTFTFYVIACCLFLLLQCNSVQYHSLKNSTSGQYNTSFPFGWSLLKLRGRGPVPGQGRHYSMYLYWLYSSVHCIWYGSDVHRKVPHKGDKEFLNRCGQQHQYQNNPANKTKLPKRLTFFERQFYTLMSKSFQICDHFFPLLFPKEHSNSHYVSSSCGQNLSPYGWILLSKH